MNDASYGFTPTVSAFHLPLIPLNIGAAPHAMQTHHNFNTLAVAFLFAVLRLLFFNIILIIIKQCHLNIFFDNIVIKYLGTVSPFLEEIS